MWPTKDPLDRFPYVQHPDACVFTKDLPPGDYVYVQDGDGVVWVLADGLHRHPRILGGARPVAAAGELVVGGDGVVVEVNNLSGTFQHGPRTLKCVLAWLRARGATIATGAEKGFNLES